MSITDVLGFWKSRVSARTDADALVQADPELVAEIASDMFIHTDPTLYAFTCLKRATLDPAAWDWQPFDEFSNIERAAAEMRSEARTKSGFPYRAMEAPAGSGN